MATSVKRQYMGFAGVDFKNDPSLVDLNRSPDALNVYKDYTKEADCIVTRLGYIELANFIGRSNGFYIYGTKALVHAGTKLYLWDNFPEEPTENILKDDMSDAKSSFFIFNDKVYINDGENYLVYDGTLRNVSEDAFIPTTTINRNPKGGGEIYQDVNLLQPLRINTFYGDGTSKEFYLDTTGIDSVEEVYVNDELTTDYSVTNALGRVTFNTAPSKPEISGTANVRIKFKKIIANYGNRIGHCTKNLVFDNRVFFTGNIDYKNVIFHSQLNDPAYISDLSYYQDGTSEAAIKDMTVGNNILWIFKEPNQENATVFYHVPTTSSEYGRIYPSKQGNVSTGCYSKSINFNDDIVFLSKYGLEGISGNITDEQLLTHRSSFVDSKMINENNYSEAEMCEWQGYLMILIDHSIYLADTRQRVGLEYEWYLWNIPVNVRTIKEYKGNLYIGSEDGHIYKFSGTNDNGEAIVSYWTTPMDSFGYSNMLKTTNKRGGIARIKTIPNGIIKVAEKPFGKEIKYIGSKSLVGFTYENIDYGNFSYSTATDNYIVYKIKEKKFMNISLKFYSDEKDRPFGIYSAILEAFIGGYVKR